MAKRATEVTLTPEEERILREWVRNAAHQQLMAERAQIILLASERRSTTQIARALRVRIARVSKWRTRFAAGGLAALQTAERPGKPRSYDDTIDARILSLVEQQPPEPHSVWTGPLLAEAVGSVSADYVWRVLRENRITLRKRNLHIQETRTPVVRSLVVLMGLYLSSRTSGFLIGAFEHGAGAAGDPLATYIRLPEPELAAELKAHSASGIRPTLLEALQWAASLEASGRYLNHEFRTLDDFLADACARSSARELHALIVGPRAPVIPGVHPHHLPDFETWKGQLETWLAISLAGAEGGQQLIPGILAAATDFASVQRARRAAAFEWHTWSAGSRGRSMPRWTETAPL
jgi:transposase